MEQVFIVALLCVLSAWGQRIPDVKGVETTYRTETELTLEWEIVQDNRSYIYILKRNEIESGQITVSENETKVTHQVSHLMPGMNHMFTLFTSLDDRRSEGFNFSSKTIPSRVEVTVEGQTETNIMLKWKKDQRDHTYELQRDKMEPELITNGDTQVEHTVDSLSPGTKYFFTLTTVFGDLKSSAYPFQGATVPPAIQINSTISRTETSITLEWIRQKEDYTFQLKYNSVVEKITKPETIVVYVVQGLSPGTGYTFRLVTVFEELNSVESNYRDYTVPSQVDSVSVLSANDTSVNLQWNAVPGLENNNYRYILKYNSIVSEELFAVNNVVKYHVPKLIPATNYNFTLYTKFYEERSSGLTFSHMTSLSNVTEVRVTRLVTELTVEWNKLNNDDIYNYTLLRSDGTEKNFTGSSHGDVISYRYQPLKPGTVHSFTLFTVSNNVRNFGYSFKSITTLNNIGRGKNDSIDNNVVRLQDLYPGESYTVSLFYDLDSEMLHQCSHRLTLVPNTVTRLYCKYHSGGNGLEVMWEFPYGIVDVVQVDVNQKPFNIYNNNSEEKGMQKVTGLQVAQ
ncbi:hypothetical protein DNTS_022220 [Danionella cerebrum]|uniref:Fibronectin type-III domain-containing protein n=1 Tax=Danionella cerebrum TaxID=2873325 RepID=A0A553PMV5_9TELE|nr:hypothetical protein DNTS_022220 [Danionella translucida]